MYYSDKPILSKKEDFLKRKYFAELVAKSLENLNSQDTFTIGLYGQWGTGKTSLVNMILEEIKENEKVVIVRFEPWNFSSTNQLLEQFFVHLANQFHWTKDKTLKEVGNALERYSDAFDFAKVIPHVGGAISFLGKRISKGIGKRIQNNLDKNDIMCQKEKVVQLLKGQNKRILVVIDDIDRLNNEQIRQVFQLITSVAKFPNMIYLLVFDKEIVVKALEKIQEGSGEEYLEKIIQMPIQERAKIIVTSILKSAYKLEEKSTGNLLMTSSRDYAEHMVIDLFEQIEKVNRKNFLEQLINSGELDSLPSIAHVINIIELGYGRLAAEGREKSKGRIISIEELEDVEQVFKQKVKTILKENSIFDFFDYRMILYLMENFDSQFMTQRIQQELKDDIHILCFLKSTVFTWIGNGIKYAVSKEYEKYLTKERILDAIQNTQATGEMFRLSKKNQEYCAAFYLDSIGKSDDEGEVSQKDAERMIEKWRER